MRIFGEGGGDLEKFVRKPGWVIRGKAGKFFVGISRVGREGMVYIGWRDVSQMRDWYRFKFRGSWIE